MKTITVQKDLQKDFTKFSYNEIQCLNIKIILQPLSLIISIKKYSFYSTGQVVFGQIYGMADQISVPLSAAGFKVTIGNWSVGGSVYYAGLSVSKISHVTE